MNAYESVTGSGPLYRMTGLVSPLAPQPEPVLQAEYGAITGFGS